MWRSKKFLVVAVLATVVLIGGIGGAVLAADNGDGSQSKTLITRVAEILGIDQQEVEDAFTQARSEMQTETLDNYLQNLIDEGKISQEQADQYKTWLQTRPDVGPYQQQLKEWQQMRPDVPMPGGFSGSRGMGGMGGMRSFGEMRGFNSPCAPEG